MTINSADAPATLSVVVPVFDEAAVLPEFHRRLAAALEQLPLRAEIIFVNDGSNDGSLDLLHKIREHDRRVAIVDLSRNFGAMPMTLGWIMRAVTR